MKLFGGLVHGVWSFSEEAAAEKYMPQLQHNIWVVAAKSAVLSVITGDSKWVEIAAHADRSISSHRHGGEQVLALCRERRAASAIRCRAAKATDRGGAHRRNERVQCLGGVRRGLLADPFGAPRT
jgi:hypothetical protein